MQQQNRTALIETIRRRNDTFGGKPVIRDTRLSVETVLFNLSHGMSVVELQREFPVLTQDDIRASLLYAAKSVSSEEWPQMGTVLEMMADTLDPVAVTHRYPALTPEDIQACLLYAAKHV